MIAKRTFLVLIILSTIAISIANAEEVGYYVESSAPIQINLWTPLALPSGLNTVRGIRANILYGDSINVYGIDVGLVQRSRVEMSGLGVGCLYNQTGRMSGAQICLGMNVAENLTGFQIGAVNIANEVKGFQLGIINKSRSRWMPLFNWPD